MERRRPGVWLYFLIALFVFGLDYITKKLIEWNLELNERIEILGNFFIITSIRNQGAAFGMLQGQQLFFLIITVAVVAGILWYLIRSSRKGSPLLLVALSMILGGAIGNFLDRAIKGEVVDFLQFNFGSYTFPIFNLADSGIVIGVALVLLDAFRSVRQEKKQSDGNGEHPPEEQTV